MSAILAMTDLFVVSNRFPAPHATSGSNRIAVSHWRIGTEGDLPQRVHDTGSSQGIGPDVLILPPSLDSPATAEIAAPYLAWLRDRHADGTILASVCAGAFLLAETGLPVSHPLSPRAGRCGPAVDRWRSDPDGG